jgi:hypothetical protein
MFFPAVLTPFLPLIFVAAGGILIPLVAKLIGKLVTFLKSKPKLAPLAPVAELGEQALEDGIRAAEKDAGKPVLTIVKDAAEAAEADVKANVGVVEKALENEAAVLLEKPAAPVQTAPGDATVTLPAPLPAPKGFATLALMAILAAGGAVVAPATSGTALPPAPAVAVPPAATIAPYDFGLTLPGLKFPWGGSGAPIQVAGGAGFQGEANLIPVTVPVLGLVPLLSLGGVVIGDVAGTTGVTYQLSVGPQVCLLHALCLSLQSDVISGNVGGLSGFLVGKFSYANEAGFLFFNTQSILDAIAASKVP